MSYKNADAGNDLGETAECTRQIRVLLVKDGLQKRVYTIEVGADFQEIHIVRLVCAHAASLKELVGEKMIDKSLLRLSFVRNPAQPVRKYILEVKSPKLRMQVQLTASDNDRYQYVLNLESPEATHFEFEKFSKLLFNERFSDVLLCVGGRCVPAHKSILANRSPVFDALLKNETQRLNVTNTEYETLLDLLSFIYKGYVSDEDGRDLFIKYSNLLKADVKYFVSHLKEVCEEKLCLCVNVHNVLDCLILSDSCNAFSLKHSAINFFVENTKRVMEMPSYQNLVALHPQTLCQILKEIAAKETNMQ